MPELIAPTASVSSAGWGALATLFGVVYYVFGDAIRRLSTAIDIAFGVVGAGLVVAFVVWTRRKEGELQERAEREIAGSVAEELGEEESAA